MAPGRKNMTRVEMMKANIVFTTTGYPVDLEDAQDVYGPGVNPAPEDGWFWIGLTPTVAESVRHVGLHVVGTKTTTIIPPVEEIELWRFRNPGDQPGRWEASLPPAEKFDREVGRFARVDQKLGAPAPRNRAGRDPAARPAQLTGRSS